MNKKSCSLSFGTALFLRVYKKRAAVVFFYKQMTMELCKMWIFNFGMQKGKYCLLF